jgi:hypothetical protein
VNADDAPRRLGVIEAFTAVVNSCPSGAVRNVAEQALDAVKRDGADALPQQAYFVLSAVRGWQGDKASQVKDALESFLTDRDDD